MRTVLLKKVQKHFFDKTLGSGALPVDMLLFLDQVRFIKG